MDAFATVGVELAGEIACDFGIKVTLVHRSDELLMYPRPETLNPDPEPRTPNPKTQNPKPETQNPKLETRNPKPKNRKP